MVPMPENSSVVAGGKPVRTGTRNVAPNIATTCCAPRPKVRGQLTRSPGATTKSGSACESTRVHRNVIVRLHTMTAEAASQVGERADRHHRRPRQHRGGRQGE